jgi:hypothetical protein
MWSPGWSGLAIHTMPCHYPQKHTTSDFCARREGQGYSAGNDPFLQAKRGNTKGEKEATGAPDSFPAPQILRDGIPDIFVEL